MDKMDNDKIKIDVCDAEDENRNTENTEKARRYTESLKFFSFALCAKIFAYGATGRFYGSVPRFWHRSTVYTTRRIVGARQLGNQALSGSPPAAELPRPYPTLNVNST
jgi:uncharacterized membrane protein YjjP (DUF1212 family)